MFNKGVSIMTANELKQRQARSESLRVIQVDEDQFWVESSEGKICYRVLFEGDKVSCTCGDYTRGIKADGNFRCKHVISVFNCIPAGEVKNGKLLERGKPKLDDRFIISIDGHDFVKYQGLLDLGHQKGISQIEVDTVQLPTADNGNFAICKATVVSKNGESFTDLGDATPQNCNVKVSKHLLRLASTRAIARALRSFTNIGMTCLEELADLNDIAGNGSDSKTPKILRQAGSQLKAVKKPESVAEKSAEVRDDNQKPQIPTDKPDNSDGPKAKGNESGRQQSQAKAPETKPPKDAVPADSKTDAKNPEKQTGHPMMSEAQKRAIYNLSRRRGVSVEDLERMAFEAYAVELEHLSSRDASSFIRNLQQAS
jgi:hypothetical protein